MLDTDTKRMTRFVMTGGPGNHGIGSKHAALSIPQ